MKFATIREQPGVSSFIHLEVMKVWSEEGKNQVAKINQKELIDRTCTMFCSMFSPPPLRKIQKLNIVGNILKFAKSCRQLEVSSFFHLEVMKLQRERGRKQAAKIGLSV